jgi:hypothetical protein
MDYKIKSTITIVVILLIMVTVGFLASYFQGGITGGVIGEVVACNAAEDCNDGIACTIDSCKNQGTEGSFCANTAINFCQDNDHCCSPGCSTANDNDC